MTVSLALRALAVIPLGLCWPPLPEVSLTPERPFQERLAASEKSLKNLKKKIKKNRRRDDTVLSQTASELTNHEDKAVPPVVQPVLSAE